MKTNFLKAEAFAAMPEIQKADLQRVNFFKSEVISAADNITAPGECKV